MWDHKNPTSMMGPRSGRQNEHMNLLKESGRTTRLLKGSRGASLNTLVLDSSRSPPAEPRGSAAPRMLMRTQKREVTQPMAWVLGRPAFGKRPQDSQNWWVGRPPSAHL